MWTPTSPYWVSRDSGTHFTDSRERPSVETQGIITIRNAAKRSPDFAPACRVVQRLRDAGYTAFLVGGGVRDLVLGRAPKDFDIVTSARPNEITQLFRRTVSVGAQFGVITVLDEGGPHEVATFRAEGGYEDKRRPGWVEYADLHADLQRRDFTINGLVLDPDTFEVIDHVGGLDDLERGVIRTIGDPAARFGEDALRMIRAIRFASRFGFRLDRKTRRALVEHHADIRHVATERIWQELERMLAHRNRAKALVLMRDTDVLDEVLPELAALAKTSRGAWPPWHRTVRRIAALPDDSALSAVFAALLADVVEPDDPPRAEWDADGPISPRGAKDVAKILARLRAPNTLQKAVAAVIERRWLWRHCSTLRLGSVARILRTRNAESLLAFWQADAASMNRLTAFAPIHHVAHRLQLRGRMYGGPAHPPVTGHDLRARGLEPSSRFAELLAEAERRWLEERLETTNAVTLWLDGQILRR